MESKRNDVSRRHSVGRRVVVGGLSLVALVLLGVACGRHQDEQVASNSGSDQQLLVAQAAAPAQGAGGTSPAQTASTPEEGLSVGSADALPPDVAVEVADTLVYAGGSVEITAKGSPDVVGVTLSDGIGKKQSFVYDAPSDTWKVFYRVPIRPGTDRLGLSATAKSASQRWRRVWLFLTVRQETQGAAPDSSSKQ